jgi:uncharacterized protein (UPF0548 family)
MTWQMHRRARLHVGASTPRAQVGATVVLALPLGPVWVLAACRVMGVVDDADRKGFSYATLPGHPEYGREDFVIEQHEDGSVWFVLCAVSRPGSVVTSLFGPAGRLVQRRITERYLRAFSLDFI